MGTSRRRRVFLVQLPIPPLSPAPIRGNVPLAAAYLKLFAQHQGLNAHYDIEIVSAAEANTLGDQALVRALAERDPWLVGFTCYVWNIERTLWVAAALKRARPDVRIVLGGPEITADNAWVLESPAYDFAVIGEGEQTFAQLLQHLREDEAGPTLPIPGLYVPAPTVPHYDPARRPPPRVPLPDLNQLGSPYTAGILDAADEQMMLLETIRGCVFKCKFCYYPKSYDRQYYVAAAALRAQLRHAQERDVREVVLLDPTLNQRKDFDDFLRLLAEANPGRRFRYFGELRGEGITAASARLLREANFTEVEVGLQSTDPAAMTLMDRKNNLRCFERGVEAMLAEGIQVKVDLIVGLPGDTSDSVRRSMQYLRDRGLYHSVQVFNLAVLPGTAFRHEAAALGLRYQPRPPYSVLGTPTLDRGALLELMQEAQELFGVEFDAPPAPVLPVDDDGPLTHVWRVDLDRASGDPPPAERRAQAFTLWLRGRNLDGRRVAAAAFVRRVLAENPFTTLQVLLEPSVAESAPACVTPSLAETLMAACQERPTYLDQLCAVQPGRLNGAKRLVVLLPLAVREQLNPAWRESLGELVSFVWRGPVDTAEAPEFDVNEYLWMASSAIHSEAALAEPRPWGSGAC
jgi:radical SAM superfamily enzyme YgiQ (UPF0313 family)